MSTSITAQGFAVLDEAFEGTCSDIVRRLGRIDQDPFGSLDVCRQYWLPNTAVIDVGANIGCWSVPMAESVGEKGHVYSFEGDPETFECLQFNTSSFHNVRCRNAAAWDVDGKIRFIVNHANRDCGAVSMIHADSSISVDAVTLDSLMVYQRVSFIKIDVEGAEFHVLRGAQSLIQEDAPVLFLETLEHAQRAYGNTLEELLEWIRSKGYSITSLNDHHDILCLPT